MSDTSAPDSAALERRYRRLLTCYPAPYRSEYGEEIIGVLLASTPADQDRPTTAEAMDLIGGGLRAWFRLLRTGDGDSPWRDTLAVFSVIAPVLVFVPLAGDYLDSIPRLNRFDALVYRPSDRVTEMAIASTVALAAVVICPILARRGRAAAMTATAIGVLAFGLAAAVLSSLLVFYGLSWSWGGYLGLMLMIEIVAVVASPGPGPGWRLLGRRGLVVLIATAVALALAAWLRLAGIGQGTNSFGLGDLANSVDEIAPLVGVTLIAVTLRWPAGGRMLALFALPGYLLIGFNAVSWIISYFDPAYWQQHLIFAELEYLPVVVIGALIAVAVWRSSRRSRRNA